MEVAPQLDSLSNGHESIQLLIADESGIGDARRRLARLARESGCDEALQGRLSLVVTEIVTNMVVHGGGGELLLRVHHSGGPIVDVLALDKGPGMVNVEACLEDGYSTAGTRGVGLGGIRRTANTFEIYSEPGKGTLVYASLQAKNKEMPGPVEVGAVCVSIAGETVCGDAWAIRNESTHTYALVADGLGHGRSAALASGRAVATFEALTDLQPSLVVRALHEQLRDTRGAAVGVIDLDWQRRKLSFAGVGNINGVIASDSGTRSLTSYNGIIGERLTKVQDFTYDWPERAVLVLHSDGLSSRWQLPTYPQLLFKHPALIAGVLYRDFARPRDDSTVVAIRARRGL